jgi:protein-S-isoprenylcysteine O-methyltransferase Ste14
MPAAGGVALLGNSLRPLVLLPFVLVVFQRQVLRREEPYLTHLFGRTYESW